jgi:hypothetical protein
MSTLQASNRIIPTKRFANGRVVPLGGTNFNLGGHSFKVPCSQHEYVSMTGFSIIKCDMESVQIYPSMGAREVLAQIVEEGYVSGVKDPTYLIPDDGRASVCIAFPHLCKLLNARNNFLRQSPDEGVRFRLTKRNGSDPHEFVVRRMTERNLWNIGLTYKDLCDNSVVTSRLVLAA